MPPELTLVPATPADLPVMQNLARFYVYDIARYCGELPGWDCPADGLWECIAFDPYFGDTACHPFLLRAGEVPAGFVVVRAWPEGGWNMEQFFVAAPYQRRGEGRRLFHAVLARFPGPWRIEIIPANSRALAFWRQVTGEAAPGRVRETAEPLADGAPGIALRFEVGVKTK